MKSYKIIPLLVLVAVMAYQPQAKSQPQEVIPVEGTDELGWKLEQQVVKDVDNLQFTFPAEGYAYENREAFVKECQEAIKSNCKILEVDEYNEVIKIRFVRSRAEMFRHVGMEASGISNSWLKEVYLLATTDKESPEAEKIIKPPTKHELMHMMSNILWTYPQPEMNWMNEGLATLAEDNCNGYRVSEIYRYMLENDLLYPMDSLSSDFYATDEMTGYHQAAYITQYLKETYGTDKLRDFWQHGFAGFEKIYGKSWNEMEKDINRKVREMYAEVPDINWGVFSEGCKS